MNVCTCCIARPARRLMKTFVTSLSCSQPPCLLPPYAATAVLAAHCAETLPRDGDERGSGLGLAPRIRLALSAVFDFPERTRVSFGFSPIDPV
jgi:hypothetical protein